VHITFDQQPHFVNGTFLRVPVS